jgi:hypothetical protein
MHSCLDQQRTKRHQRLAEGAQKFASCITHRNAAPLAVTRMSRLFAQQFGDQRLKFERAERLDEVGGATLHAGLTIQDLPLALTMMTRNASTVGSARIASSTSGHRVRPASRCREHCPGALRKGQPADTVLRLEDVAGCPSVMRIRR